MKDYQALELTRAVNTLNIEGLYRLARLLHHAKLVGEDPTSARIDELVESATKVAGDINRHQRQEAGD